MKALFPLCLRVCGSLEVSRRSVFMLAFAVGTLGLASMPSVHADEAKGTGKADSSTVAAPDAGLGWSTNHPEGNDEAWEFRWGGKLVTTYHSDLDGTPGFFPLQTPSELELTRQFPLGPSRAFEKEDHDHHRSLWFTHGIVNGLDFWIDDDKPHVGMVVETEHCIEAVADAAVLKTTNRWLDHDGKLVLTDARRFRFTQSAGDIVMDVTIQLEASNGDVTFGDTKEGSLGIRVAGTMKVEAKELDPRLGGHVINAEGLKDKDAWSHASAWVDYSGPLLPKAYTDGSQMSTKEELLASDWQTGGITMMYHPKNTLPECRWHVRTYGLFAANPFGRKHFGLPRYKGVKIKKGDSLNLDFRVVLHDGTFEESQTLKHFEDYAEMDLSPVDF